MIATRPASDSEIAVTSSGELDPVMTNRPDLFLFASMATRKAGKREGNNCASSIAMCSG